MGNAKHHHHIHAGRFWDVIAGSHVCRKPIIATDEGGHKETVANGRTGYLVKPDKDVIVNKVRLISKEILHGKKYKQACMANAKHYNSKRFIKEMRSLIDEVSN